MYIPLIRERVRVRGSSDLFVVSQVDYRREVAEVAYGTADGKPTQYVPFRELFATWEDPESEPSNSAAA